MHVDQIESAHAPWAFLAPISGVSLAEHDLRIVRSTLVRGKALSRKRKQLGLQAKSLKDSSGDAYSVLTKFLSVRPVYLHLRLTGVGTDKRSEFLRICEDELRILSLSQLGFRDRANKSYPCIADQISIDGKVSFLLFNTANSSWTQHNYVTTHSAPLEVNAAWHSFHKKRFFLKLLKILRDEIHVEAGWRKTLYNAAILGGLSQGSTDITAAFLWNMIAIEMLSTLDREKHADALPERIEAFFGWIGYWDSEGYGEKMKSCYDKRCAIVHNGSRSLIEPQDLYFTDIILLNLFSTLVQHHKIFPGKDAIKGFCDRIWAEKLLNVTLKARPKTFQFIKMPYIERDYR